MTHKEYNGWTNYETWLVKLWMDNDEGSNRFWREDAASFVRRDSEPVSSLADKLKESRVSDIIG